LNLVAGMGDQASSPRAHMSHSLDGSVASPGKRPAMPITAMGFVASRSGVVILAAAGSMLDRQGR